MKVVLFCGGQGLRLRDYSENTPKPMVPVGYRPIIWHLMKYYAHFGHKEFILCLGWKADVIKDYFLNYNETVSNDFVLTAGGRNLKLINSDIHDWSITFVDTGMESNIGMRLMKVKEYIDGDEMFLANYADCITDARIDVMVDHLKSSGKMASFISVPPSTSFHVVKQDDSGKVCDLVDARVADIRINGGYFTFRREIFDHIEYGDELVHEPFRRLIAKDQLTAFRHDGFWACMDTFKEKMILDDLVAKGTAPWEVWKKPSPTKLQIA